MVELLVPREALQITVRVQNPIEERIEGPVHNRVRLRRCVRGRIGEIAVQRPVGRIGVQGRGARRRETAGRSRGYSKASRQRSCGQRHGQITDKNFQGDLPLRDVP